MQNTVYVETEKLVVSCDEPPTKSVLRVEALYAGEKPNGRNETVLTRGVKACDLVCATANKNVTMAVEDSLTDTGAKALRLVAANASGKARLLEMAVGQLNGFGIDIRTGDALNALVLHLLSNIFDQLPLVYLVGQLGDDDAGAVLAELLKLGAGADDHLAARALRAPLVGVRPAEPQRPLVRRAAQVGAEHHEIDFGAFHAKVLRRLVRHNDLSGLIR